MKQSKKKNKKFHILSLILLLIFAISLSSILLFLRFTTNPRVKVLESVFFFSTQTLKNNGYFLHDINIMELLSDYGNGDTEINAHAAVDDLEEIKASTYADIYLRRSFSQKRLSANSKMKVLFVEMGEMNTFAENNTLYLEAPLISNDFGYAFPTNFNFFPKMPEFTHDIDREWFSENMSNIVELTKQMSIEKTGSARIDENGVISYEYKTTIYHGTGQFIWELIGLEPPEYDLVVYLYLTKNNHINCIIPDLSHKMPEATCSLQGDNLGTLIFDYKLPDDEAIHGEIKRNDTFEHRFDINYIYNTNIEKKYSVSFYFTWENAEEGFDFKANDIIFVRDNEKLADSYIKGTVKPTIFTEDVWNGKDDELYSLEVLDWYEVRKDIDGFIHDIIDNMNLFGKP